MLWCLLQRERGDSSQWPDIGAPPSVRSSTYNFTFTSSDLARVMSDTAQFHITSWSPALIFREPAIISRHQVSQCCDPRNHGETCFYPGYSNLSDATVFPHFLQQTIASAFCVFQSSGHTLTLLTTSSPLWLHPLSSDQDPLITIIMQSSTSLVTLFSVLLSKWTDYSILQTKQTDAP